MIDEGDCGAIGGMKIISIAIMDIKDNGLATKIIQASGKIV
jgi:hypothetical protein